MNNILQNTFRLTLGGGDVQATGGSYIERPADEELYKACLERKFSYILACRQIGKSSLKNAVAQRLRTQGIRVVSIELVAGKSVESAEVWYFSLLHEIVHQLDLTTDIVKQWWNTQSPLLTPAIRFMHFLEGVLLVKVNDPIVIFIDEIDVLLGLPFTDDVFATIRSIYNRRARNTSYERLTFVLIGVATPDQLIIDDNRTSYNIGQSIPILDFSFEEGMPFQSVIQSKYPDKAQLFYKQIYDWTNGHPYLTQKLTYAVLNTPPSDNPSIIDDLVTRLFFREGTFAESNLNFVQTRVLDDQHSKQMLRTYRNVLRGKQKVEDKKSPAINRLKLYGLVTSEAGKLRIRNKIYQEVFNLSWCKENDPPERYRMVAILTTWIAAIVILFAGLVFWNNSIRIPNLAKAIESEFLQTTVPQLQFEQLIKLIELDDQILFFPSNTNYADLANDLFFRLPIDRQLAIFEVQPANSSTLIENLYTTLGDVHLLDTEEEHNRTEILLTQMASTINDAKDDSENGRLKREINNWVQARQLVRTGDYSQAVRNYTRALEENGSNPATRYERALIWLKLERYEAALKDMEQVASIINQLAPETLLTISDSSTISETLSFTPTFTQIPIPILAQSTANITSIPTNTQILSIPSPTPFARYDFLKNSDDLWTPGSTDSPIGLIEHEVPITETISVTARTSTSPVLSPNSDMMLTQTPVVFQKILPNDFVVALRFLFAQHPQLLTETNATPAHYPNLSTLDLIPDILKFRVEHQAYRNKVRTSVRISHEDDSRLDNSDGNAPLEVRFEITRNFNYKMEYQLDFSLPFSQSLESEIGNLYELPSESPEIITQTSRCMVDIIIPPGKIVDIGLLWVEKWAEGIINETVNNNVKKRGNFSVFIGYEPCEVGVQEFDSPQSLEFAVKHLNDIAREQVTDTLSYIQEAALDNSTGLVPLQVQIEFQRNYRHQINERLNTTEILEGNPRDKIVELYQLPANNPEESEQTALCPVSIVIPAGQKATVTVEWTERWAEGVINEGLDGSGNRLGSYEVFLGYVEPCSLVDQENVSGSVDTSTQDNCTMLIKCVIINKGAPYAELPEIIVATQFNLVASPSHPTSFLVSDSIPNGGHVQVIGMDKDGAWLLVQHNDTLGWMPTIFSRTNVATLESALMVEPLSGNCTTYLDATYASDQVWTSTIIGSAFVVGSIYRAEVSQQFEKASLQIKLDGSGVVTKSDYIHALLTESSAVVLFAFSIDSLQQNSQISFDLTDFGNESLSFQATFYSNECSNEEFTLNSELVDGLPIGIQKPSITE